jgi:cytosine deaminase
MTSHSHSFLSVPKDGSYRIINARVPADLVPVLANAATIDGITDCELVVGNGKVELIGAPDTLPATPGLPTIDLDNGIVMPRFVEVHTHLDKSHIWPRIQNENGTVLGARKAIEFDRERRWTADDVRQRMDFSLRCAYAHGTGAIRTHIDSYGKQTAISFPVFAETREAWKDRISLQAVALFPTTVTLKDEAQFRNIADIVEKHGGIMGGVTAPGGQLSETVDQELDRLFQMAASRGLEVDLHVDETTMTHVRTLENIADAALRNRFNGRILCGHCCSLSLIPDEDFKRIAGKLAEADIAVVSLPMVNMYLQDRGDRRTPRLRGVAPLHELAEAGVRVMVSSDNTRDPYHAYGDLDMLEVFREATRILHFDHSERSWTRMLGAAQAEQMGLKQHGLIAAGQPADLVLTRARTFQDLLTRPQFDRVVLVNGRQIDTTLPDYRELDHLYAATTAPAPAMAG